MMKNQKGYSMIEIGVGLLIIAIFSIFSVALFNGCYNNHNVIKRTNIALSHAINEMETILQKDYDNLGFTLSMIERDDILTACSNATADERAEGKYAVPDDETIDVDNDMTATIQYRRVPTSSSSQAYDNTVMKIIVTVNYKIRANDAVARTLQLETIKLTK